MSINIQQLSSRIKVRLQEEENEKINSQGEFKVVSESNSNDLISSVRKVTKDKKQNTGLVRTVIKEAPSAILEMVNNQIQKDVEFNSTASFGEQARRDLVEKPAKILGSLGQMVLSGLSSVGKTVIETVYSPIIGKEKTREQLQGDPKLEKILFGGETKSWQNIKEDVDEYTQESDIATEWEKKNLGLTLAVTGFLSDIIPSGGGKGRIGTKLIKELVESTDTKIVKEVLTNAKVPKAVIDDSAEALVNATDEDVVRSILRQSSSKILKQADDDAAKAGIRSLDDAAGESSTIATRNADEIASRVDEIKRTNPNLTQKAQSANTVDEFIDDVISSGNTSRESVDVPTLSRFFDEVNGVRADADITPSSTRIANDIPTELQPLAEEARKFDNADDFAASLQESIRAGENVVPSTVLDTNNLNSKAQITEFYNKATAPADAPVSQTAQPSIPDGGIPAKVFGDVEPTPVKITPQERKAIEDFDNSLMNTSPSKKPKNTEKAVQEFKDTRGKLARVRDSIIREVQDDMIEVRRLVENKSLKITDESNPYDAEIAFHGRVGTRIEDLRTKARDIDAEIVKVSKNQNIDDKKLTDEVNRYLVAKHAPERNSALGDGAAGITTKEAKESLVELENLSYSGELKRIADEIQSINNETLDILREGEVITDELYDTLRNKYKNHVPLQRIMSEEEDFAGAMAKGFDVKGTGIKTAKGSDREVNDILGNVVFNNEQAIIRAEKNRVDLSTLKMIRDNQEALSDMFKVRRPKVIGETYSGQPITEMVTDPRMLVMREKGKPIIIEIKDAQLALALRGVSRQKLSGIMRMIGAVTRTYSGLHTRFNPEFAFSNKIRDIQEVLVYTASQGELGAKGTARIAKKEARMENVRAVLDGIRGKDSDGAKMYAEMKASGGTTGGLGLSTRKQIEIDIDKVRKLNRSNPRKAAQKALEYIDNWNTVFEDSSRLSVYRAAREAGASKQRAAVLAKESSVNFNKFGKQGQIINALYIFSNASIQGTTKTLRAMKNPKVAAAVGTAVFGSVAAVAEWNNNIDPDWRNKITTWDRLNSLAIMLPSSGSEPDDDSGFIKSTGGVQYLTIPVAWGIKPLKVMADNTYDLATGNGDGLGEATKSVLVSILEAYNPAGGSDMVSTVTPTILDIPVETARNKSWSGAPIKPDWDRNAPASIQYFDSLRDSTTGRKAIAISKGLSGIGIEISPADMHYAYEQLIGGVGRFANKTVNTITAVGGEDPVLARDVPVISRFYKSRPDEEIGAGAKEFQQIAEILETQSKERFYLSQQAEDSFQQLKNLPKEEAARLFEEIREADPDLAKKIAEVKKDEDKGLTFIDRKILQLGVGNGERAKFLKIKFDELETKEEKAQLWTEYRSKGIISDSVSEQLKDLLKSS